MFRYFMVHIFVFEREFETIGQSLLEVLAHFMFHCVSDRFPVFKPDAQEALCRCRRVELPLGGTPRPRQTLAGAAQLLEAAIPGSRLVAHQVREAAMLFTTYRLQSETRFGTVVPLFYSALRLSCKMKAALVFVSNT